MNQFPPSPWVYHLGRFNFLRKFAEITAAQGAPPVSLTPMANGKNLQSEKFWLFVWSALGCRVNIIIKFFFQVHFMLLAVWYLFPLFATTVVDPWWQICRRCRWYRWQVATGVIDTGGKFAAGIVDTSGKFATGINNTRENGGKRCPWYVANLPLVSLIPAGAPWLPNISENFRKNLKSVLMDYWGGGGGGGTDSWKNQKQKISWQPL